jgi:hypothetical protein
MSPAANAEVTGTRAGYLAAVQIAPFVIYGAEPLAILSLVPILAILIGCVWPRTATALAPTTA